MRNIAVALCTGLEGRARDNAGWRAALLAAIGCLALGGGLLVYLTGRNASRSMLIPAIGALGGTHVFGVIGQWLPSFVHPFAFSLFTAAALPTAARYRYLACVVWFGVNAAFELGQHPRFSGPLARALQDSFGSNPFTQALARYFVRGTFDVGDLLAVALGALAAAWVLHQVQTRQEDSHAR